MRNSKCCCRLSFSRGPLVDSRTVRFFPEKINTNERNTLIDTSPCQEACVDYSTVRVQRVGRIFIFMCKLHRLHRSSRAYGYWRCCCRCGRGCWRDERTVVLVSVAVFAECLLVSCSTPRLRCYSCPAPAATINNVAPYWSSRIFFCLISVALCLLGLSCLHLKPVQEPNIRFMLQTSFSMKLSILGFDRIFAARLLVCVYLQPEQDPDIRFIRRMQRDIAERNRTADEVVAQYHGTVRPMHELFVEPSKVCGENKHLLDVIKAKSAVEASSVPECGRLWV